MADIENQDIYNFEDHTHPSLSPVDTKYAEPVKKKLNGYVGFANLPNQVHRKSIKKGFTFTVMVVGESGLGKSTLINTLFNAELYPPRTEQELSTETPKTVALQAFSVEFQESNVKLKLSVIDTPGFGDFVNNEECWNPILENINARFDSFLEQENRVNRKKIVDNRVHACLYFIAPTGHCLRPLDVEFMKKLHHKVNLIPIIAKSDTLTDDEIKAFKSSILEDIVDNGIQIFRPTVSELDDQESINECRDIISRVPFAVVGSTTEIDLGNGKLVRGRKYPWGVIEVDNEEHNDFLKLRQMLIRTHMEELKEVTNSILYENYRSEKLSSGTYSVDKSGQVNPLLKFEEERAAHEAKMAKLEAEMKQVFEMKVAEKEAKMRQNEQELYEKHRESREAIERKRRELEEKKNRLEGKLAITPEKLKPKKTGLFK